ncbi:MAG: GTPase family protein [Candidatus Ornithomonoglobus sp.]
MRQYSDYRDVDFAEKLDKLGYTPLDVMITGVTGAGKSTTLNAVFQRTVAAVGDGVDPETMTLDPYRLSRWLRLWDTPGLGDGIEQDIRHSKGMIDLLYKTFQCDGREYGFIDLVIVIIEGSNRDMGTTYRLINDVIAPNIESSRIVVAINQADMAMKGRHWNYTLSRPDDVLKGFLEEQALSIQRRVKEATGKYIKKPVYYSAQQHYNIESFLDCIIDSIPTARRTINQR